MKMKTLKVACTVGLATMANSALASEFDIQLRDFALPGHVSDHQLLGWCNPTGAYEVNCGYSGPLWDEQLVTSDDKNLVLKITHLFTVPGTVGYDRYVVFREKGNNPTIDDVMRVQFSVLENTAFVPRDTHSGLGSNLVEAEVTISLISGGMVPDYMARLPGTADKVGDYENTVNQEYFFPSSFLVCNGITQVCGADMFNLIGADGPRFEGEPTIFSVIPTFVPEPSSVLLSSLGLAVLARRRNRR